MSGRPVDAAQAREPGATFAPGDIAWIDFETRSGVSIKCGSDRYSRHAEATVLAWALGNGPVSVEAVRDFPATLRWADMPRSLHHFFDRAAAGEAVFCAHNANFDRSIWNNACDGFPYLSPDMVIDTRVQATASGLPATLKDAARFAGAAELKDKAGRDLLKLFAYPASGATPLSHPDEWQAFLAYARQDVMAMRDLFKHTRQLPLAEWREYWASELVNDTGVTIDLDLAAAAARMAMEDQQRTARDLRRLTGGVVETVNQVARMILWLHRVLDSDGREMLVKRYDEYDEDGTLLKPGKWSLTRDRVIRLIAYLEDRETPDEARQAALRLLQIRLYGGSKTPAKFGRMLASHVDGVIRGQYVFNGAAQTGRMSAKGIQIHNLARDTLDYEIDAIDALTGFMPWDGFAQLGDATPVSRKLSLLIRPTLVAPPGSALVWSDWANIEARVTPWLADDEEAGKRLDVFRAVDADPRIPDIYTRTAADVSGLPIDMVDKKIRQRGKVVDLACQFGGGTNALLSMAASFGMHLPETEAKAAVERWREANPWAQRFWGKHDHYSSYGLWGAVNEALETPGQIYAAGRISYVFVKAYLGGSLFCVLPSGRCLVYRRIRWERVDDIDEDTGEVIDSRMELMFARDMGRVKLWPGLCCENVTQAVAADLLRGTLVRLAEEQYDWMPTVLHTHDEVVCEAGEGFVGAAAKALVAEMERGFDWTAGLPIKADATIGRWYSKNKTSWGL